MSRVLLATVAYAPIPFVIEGLANLYATTESSEYDCHSIFDPGFPGNDPNSPILAGARRIENRGCHGNFQHALELMCAKSGDLFAPVCPDVRARNKGWVKACAEVLRADPDCFTVQLNRPIDYTPWKPETLIVGGHEVLKFNQLVAWSCGMFSVEHLLSVGGFGAYNPQYGYSEHWLCDKLIPKGKHWYLLKNYFDDTASNPDAKYILWKQLSAAHHTDLPYDQWLKGNP